LNESTRLPAALERAAQQHGTQAPKATWIEHAGTAVHDDLGQVLDWACRDSRARRLGSGIWRIGKCLRPAIKEDSGKSRLSCVASPFVNASMRLTCMLEAHAPCLRQDTCFHVYNLQGVCQLKNRPHAYTRTSVLAPHSNDRRHRVAASHAALSVDEFLMQDAQLQHAIPWQPCTSAPAVRTPVTFGPDHEKPARMPCAHFWTMQS